MNINTAIAQANRLQRAQAILDAGYSFEKDKDFDIWAVTKPGGHTAADYWIGEDGRCDCPDSMKGNHCKHMLALSLIKQQEADERDDEAAMWEAQCAEHDAEHARLLSGVLIEQLLPPPFCGQEPDARALQVLNRQRERIAQELDNAEFREWDARAKELRNALLVHDEFTCKYRIGWWQL